MAMVKSNLAWEKSSNIAQAYNNRAIVYFQFKQYTKAWEDLQKAKELGYPVDPGFITTLKKALDR